MTNPETNREDFQRAVRILLAKPLLTSAGGDADAIALVHSKEDALQAWFRRNVDWQLHVGREVVRLFKIPERWPAFAAEAPNQRRCVLYCLVLAGLEDCGEQTVITELAEKVSVLAATREDLANYEPEHFRERQDFVAVLRTLREQGVLTPTRDTNTTDNDEYDYIHADGNALYDVNHRAAAVILSSPVAPSRAGHPDRLTAEAIPDTPEGLNRHRRVALTRWLVDTPALYFDELPDDQVSYFHSQRYLLLREIDEGVGGRVEVRAEGAALIDDELTDIRFPLERTAQFAALAYVEALACEPTPNRAEPTVSEARLTEITEQVTERVCQVARTIAGQPVTAASVRSTALDVLAMLRLVEPMDGGLRLLPALGRYRSPTLRSGRPATEPSDPAVPVDEVEGIL